MDLGDRAEDFRYLVRDRAGQVAEFWNPLRDCAGHYNADRPHQSRQERRPGHDESVVAKLDAPVLRRKVLGGVSTSTTTLRRRFRKLARQASRGISGAVQVVTHLKLQTLGKGSVWDSGEFGEASYFGSDEVVVTADEVLDAVACVGVIADVFG